MLNPFDTQVRYENDIEDFKIPYKIYSKLDAAILARKYMQLRKRSKPYNARLGVYNDAQS